MTRARYNLSRMERHDFLSSRDVLSLDWIWRELLRTLCPVEDVSIKSTEGQPYGSVLVTIVWESYAPIIRASSTLVSCLPGSGCSLRNALWKWRWLDFAGRGPGRQASMPVRYRHECMFIRWQASQADIGQTWHHQGCLGSA